MGRIYKEKVKESTPSSNEESQSIFKRHHLIRASSLSMSHKHYLLELNMYLGLNQDAWPAQSTIAKAMSAGLSSVKKWQAELMKMGILIVDSGKGCNSSNRYRLNLLMLPIQDDTDTELSMRETVNGLPDRPIDIENGLPDRPEWSTTETINGLPDRPLMVYDVATKEHTKRHVKEHVKEHSLTRVSVSGSGSELLNSESQASFDPGVDILFEMWYSVYPRHIGKGAAEKAFRSQLKKLSKRYSGNEKEAVEFLIARTKEFASSNAGKLGQYTAYPGTWLNQARFDDDVNEWGKDPAVNGKSHSDFGKYDPDAPDEPW